MTSLCQQREVNIIKELNKVHDFDHNIFLLDSKITHSERFQASWNWAILHGENPTPQTVYIVDYDNTTQPAVVSTREAKASKSPFLIVVAETLRFKSDLLTQIWVVCQQNSRAKVGIFLNQGSIDIAVGLFRWTQRLEIFNIFCVFYTKSNGHIVCGTYST